MTGTPLLRSLVHASASHAWRDCAGLAASATMGAVTSLGAQAPDPAVGEAAEAADVTGLGPPETPHDAWSTRAEGASPMLVGAVLAVGARVPGLASLADLLTAVAARFSRHRGSILAAGFAYFALLAIVPSAIALGSLAAWVGDARALREALERAIDRVPTLDGSATSVLEGLIDVIDSTSGTTFGVTTVVALGFAVYASSKAFVTTSQVLDLAYDRPPRERSWLVRIVAAVVVMVTLIGIVIGVVVVQSLPRLQRALGVTASFDGTWANVVLVVAVVGVLLVLIGVGFRLGAPAESRPGWVGAGAVLATFVIAAATILIGVYVQLSSVIGTAVAVLGGSLVLLLWLYFVGTAIVIGAELDAVRSRRQSS